MGHILSYGPSIPFQIFALLIVIVHPALADLNLEPPIHEVFRLENLNHPTESQVAISAAQGIDDVMVTSSTLNPLSGVAFERTYRCSALWLPYTECHVETEQSLATTHISQLPSRSDFLIAVKQTFVNLRQNFELSLEIKSYWLGAEGAEFRGTLEAFKETGDAARLHVVCPYLPTPISCEVEALSPVVK